MRTPAAIENSLIKEVGELRRRIAKLALSLTRKLVDLHGGRIWAQSEGEGKGSKITLRIPV